MQTRPAAGGLFGILPLSFAQSCVQVRSLSHKIVSPGLGGLEISLADGGSTAEGALRRRGWLPGEEHGARTLLGRLSGHLSSHLSTVACREGLDAELASDWGSNL